MKIRNDLSTQLPTITPTYLLGKDVIKKMVGIYTEFLDENQTHISSPINVLDVDYLLERYIDTDNERFDTLRSEVFKVKLNEIYRVFHEMTTSEEVFEVYKKRSEIVNDFDEQGDIDEAKYKIAISMDIHPSIGSEYINSGNYFKQKKGTSNSIKYMFNILDKSGVQTNDSTPFLSVTDRDLSGEFTPYNYKIQSSLHNSIYNETLKKLTHPLGFQGDYARVNLSRTEDYFGVDVENELHESYMIYYEDGDYRQQEVLEYREFGDFQTYNIVSDNKMNEQIVYHYTANEFTEKNLTLVLHFDGRLVLYNRDEKNIIDLKMVNPEAGKLITTSTETQLGVGFEDVIDSITFTEFSLMGNKNVQFKYKIYGDIEGKYHISNIRSPENKELSAFSKKYYDDVIYTKENLLNSCTSVFGSVERDFGIEGKLLYSYKSKLHSNIEDTHPLIMNIKNDSVGKKVTVDDIIIPPIPDDVEAWKYEEIEEFINADYAHYQHFLPTTIKDRPFDLFGRLDLGNRSLTMDYGDTGLDPAVNIGNLKPQVKYDRYGVEYELEDGSITDVLYGGDWYYGIWKLPFKDKSEVQIIDGKPYLESYHKPSGESDLSLLKSTLPLPVYERENTDYEEPPESFWLQEDVDFDFIIQNNNDAIIWEAVTSELHFTIDKSYINIVTTDEDTAPKVGSGIKVGYFKVGVLSDVTEDSEEHISRANDQTSTEEQYFEERDDEDVALFGVWKKNDDGDYEFVSNGNQ